MSVNNFADSSLISFIEQPNSVAGLNHDERNAFIISLRRIDGRHNIISRYGDDIWWLVGSRRNVTKSNTKIDFTKLPAPFRHQAKAIVYRYIRRGAAGRSRPPAPSTIIQFFRNIKLFFDYLKKIRISKLSQVTDIICTNYFSSTKKQKIGTVERALSPRAIEKKIKSVEIIFSISQFTDDPLSISAEIFATNDEAAPKKRNHKPSKKTPLMPDEVFCALFDKAWSVVSDGARLLGLRANLEGVRAEKKENPSKKYITMLKTPALTKAGYDGTYLDFKNQLKDIRIACYVVIASLSGCRVHELANMRAGNYYSTVEDGGERYWWIRSESNKTYEGLTEWMVPEAAITAIRVLEEWAKPYHERLHAEIEAYRQHDPDDIRIAEAEEHLNSLLVGIDSRNGGLVRTLGSQAFNIDLKEFAESCGLSWIPTTHQFRRKFANYVAHSKFGDLRYLREHFKHWSMDMTLGYALNESQEMALFLEIQDEMDEIKVAVVDSWLDNSEPLAGGYGGSLVAWRKSDETVTMFKSHGAMVRSIALSTPIRSNGHAWCTAEDNLCVGNDVDKTRCGAGCDSAVVGRTHSTFYTGLLSHQRELADAKDIGPGGLARVQRDIARCEAILATLS